MKELAIDGLEIGLGTQRCFGSMKSRFQEFREERKKAKCNATEENETKDMCMMDEVDWPNWRSKNKLSDSIHKMMRFTQKYHIRLSTETTQKQRTFRREMVSRNNSPLPCLTHLEHEKSSFALFKGQQIWLPIPKKSFWGEICRRSSKMTIEVNTTGVWSSLKRLKTQKTCSVHAHANFCVVSCRALAVKQLAFCFWENATVFVGNCLRDGPNCSLYPKRMSSKSDVFQNCSQQNCEFTLVSGCFASPEKNHLSIMAGVSGSDPMSSLKFGGWEGVICWGPTGSLISGSGRRSEVLTPRSREHSWSFHHTGNMSKQMAVERGKPFRTAKTKETGSHGTSVVWGDWHLTSCQWVCPCWEWAPSGIRGINVVLGVTTLIVSLCSLVPTLCSLVPHLQRPYIHHSFVPWDFFQVLATDSHNKRVHPQTPQTGWGTQTP